MAYDAARQRLRVLWKCSSAYRFESGRVSCQEATLQGEGPARRFPAKRNGRCFPGVTCQWAARRPTTSHSFMGEIRL